MKSTDQKMSENARKYEREDEIGKRLDTEEAVRDALIAANDEDLEEEAAR